MVDGTLDLDRRRRPSRHRTGLCRGGLDASFDLHLRIDLLDGNGTTDRTVFEVEPPASAQKPPAEHAPIGRRGRSTAFAPVRRRSRLIVLHVTGVQPHPDNWTGGSGYPQGFAVRLLGWSFHVEDARDTTSHPMLDGLISGGGVAVFTGVGANDGQPQCSTSVVGLLGVGQIDVIPDDKGQLRVDYTDQPRACRHAANRQWGGDTDLCSVLAMGSAGTERTSGHETGRSSTAEMDPAHRSRGPFAADASSNRGPASWREALMPSSVYAPVRDRHPRLDEILRGGILGSTVRAGTCGSARPRWRWSSSCAARSRVRLARTSRRRSRAWSCSKTSVSTLST